MPIARAACLVVLIAVSGCGGGSSPAAPTPAGPQTETFSGTAQITASGTCNGPGHRFTTGPGNLSITVVQSTGTTVAVQVCHPTAINHATECTVPPFHRIDVGRSLGATIKGGRDQVLTIYPRDCMIPGAAATSIDYTVTLQHPGA